MNVTGAAANLNQATKELLLAWQEAGNYWRDQKRAEFEHHYLEQLPHDVSRAVVVIKELSAVLDRIRKDCE